MGKIYYTSNLANRDMSTAKRIYINLRGQATPQPIAIYYNLRQSIAIYYNLSVPVTLSSIIITSAVTARKEERISAYMDIRTA